MDWLDNTLVSFIINALIAWLIAWLIACQSVKAVDKKLTGRKIKDDIYTLESAINLVWNQEGMSSLTKDDVVRYESKIVNLLDRLERNFEDFLRNKLKLESVMEKMSELSKNATLDIEKLSDEKNTGAIFETRLERSNRIEKIDKIFKELKQLV